MSSARAAWIISYRDLLRFWKYKWWLAGLVAMNLTDLFIFALVFRGIVRRELVPDYFQFLAPGIASIAAFAAAFTIGREVMMELRRDYHLYLLSLPISHWDLVAGRILAGMIRGLIYQAPFMILILLLTQRLPSFAELMLVLSASVMIVVSMSSLSIATTTIAKTLEVQAAIRSLVYFVGFFMSTVFYPENVIRTRFPEFLHGLIINNPVSLATAIYRVAFTPHMAGEVSLMEAILKLSLWTIVLTIIGSYLYLRNLRR